MLPRLAGRFGDRPADTEFPFVFLGDLERVAFVACAFRGARARVVASSRIVAKKTLREETHIRAVWVKGDSGMFIGEPRNTSVNSLSLHCSRDTVPYNSDARLRHPASVAASGNLAVTVRQPVYNRVVVVGGGT